MLAFVLSPFGRKILVALAVMTAIAGGCVWIFERGRTYQATIDNVAALKTQLATETREASEALALEKASSAAQLDEVNAEKAILQGDLDAAKTAEQSAQTDAEGMKANNARLKGDYDAMVQASLNAPAGGGCVLGDRAGKLRDLK